MKLLLILVVYIFGATLATILLFQKKELNFFIFFFCQGDMSKGRSSGTLREKKD